MGEWRSSTRLWSASLAGAWRPGALVARGAGASSAAGRIWRSWLASERSSARACVLSHATHVWRVPEARGWNALLDDRAGKRQPLAVARQRLGRRCASAEGAAAAEGLRCHHLLATHGASRILGRAARPPLPRCRPQRSDHLYGCAHRGCPSPMGSSTYPRARTTGAAYRSPRGLRLCVSRVAAPWLVENDSAAIGNPEQAMWRYLAAQQLWIERFPRPMVVVMQQGDANRWGTTTTEPMPGACGADAAWLKYSSEYVLMAGTCNLTMEPCPSHAQTATANFLRWCDRQRTLSPLRGCGLKLRRRIAPQRDERGARGNIASQNATARARNWMTVAPPSSRSSRRRSARRQDLSAPSPHFETGLDDDSLPGGAGGDGLGSCAVVSSEASPNRRARCSLSHRLAETDVGGRTSIVALNSHNARRLAQLLDAPFTATSGPPPTMRRVFRAVASRAAAHSPSSVARTLSACAASSCERPLATRRACPCAAFDRPFGRQRASGRASTPSQAPASTRCTWPFAAACGSTAKGRRHRTAAL